ncbi:MAG: nitroreductase family protein [Candidatus Nitrosotenuis sp.]
MSFFDLIESRHSVRAFKDKKLAQETIGKIASAATKAASAGNLQSYQIFIITKKEDKKMLADAAHGQNFIEDASAVFVFCADTRASAQDYGRRGEELYCIQDATIACTYAQLAAHSLGLASVWVGSFDEDSVSGILGLNSNLRPVAMLVVGFAAEEPEITPRKPVDEMVHKL